MASTISLIIHSVFDPDVLEDQETREKMQEVFDLARQILYLRRRNKRWSRDDLDAELSYYEACRNIRRDYPDFPWVNPHWVVGTLEKHLSS